MLLWTLVVFLSVVSRAYTMNKPVYKIMLEQKGFAQFLQYDVMIPPLREFTFCTWIRFYNVDGDQSIFTYVANGNNRVVRLWLDSGGHYIKISINDVSASVPVDILKDVWQHVCFSYQSDYGAWALYIDSRLMSCEAAQSLYGFVIPGSGSIIIGYGTASDGTPNGLLGEIFGANMILMSTIERNYTIKNHPRYEQKSFERNKIRTSNNIKYVVLKDLQGDFDTKVNTEKTSSPSYMNITTTYVTYKPSHSTLDHDIGKDLTARKPKQIDTSDEKEMFDVLDIENIQPGNGKNNINFWNLVNNAGNVGKFKVKQKKNEELSGSGTHDLPTISEYETPPLQGTHQDYLARSLEMDKPPVTESIYKISEDANNFSRNLYTKRHMNDISEVETPPPPETDSKLYGQWTSSRFAGSVLNYLKSINFHNKEKRVPTTIPLTKMSDAYPYSSDLKVNIVKPPIQLKRKNLIIEKRFHNPNSNAHPSLLKRLHVKRKREAQQHQINVQILENDVRSDILRSHAKTHPKQVEVTVRGETKKNNDHRFYRNVDGQESFENSVESTQTSSLSTMASIKNHNLLNVDIHKSNSLLTVLPFLKSVEYFTEESEKNDFKKEKNSKDMYSKSLSNGNMWHNVKSYNNDYTPRKLNMKLEDYKIPETNLKHPSIRLKYKPESHKLVENKEDKNIIKGRQLAMSVSNQSDYNKDSISILKYNHGFLPGHDKKKKVLNNISSPLKLNTEREKNSFNKHIKIGNALNERHVIGFNEDQRKKSFVGGNEKIPDINRYRSDIDKGTENTPSSLKPRICKNVELYDYILYVQPDESIDMTHILSPIKKKNIGIDFILQNYKKCSLEESSLGKSALLLLHWSRTPVRLFGGAHPKKTTDLCGFF